MLRWAKCGLLATAGLGFGCVGQIGDGGAGTDVGERPSASDMRRLTAEQYRRTVGDLFAGMAIDVDLVAGIALAKIPADGTQSGGYTRMDTRLAPPHVDAYFDVADAFGREVEANPDARSAVIGDCANDAALTNECIDGFLDTFALRAFRRPLDAEERDRFHAMNDGTHDGPELARGLVFATLMSPQFLYHVEVRGPSIDGDDRFLLDGYALASRLSYHFWNSM